MAKLHRPRAWVINFAAALNAPAGLLEELATYPADEDVFALAASSGPVVQSLRAVIYNAIFACAADGAYSPQEPDLIRRLGAQFGVIEAVISQIIDGRGLPDLSPATYTWTVNARVLDATITASPVNLSNGRLRTENY